MVRWLKCARVIAMAGALLLCTACVSSQSELREGSSPADLVPVESEGVRGIVDRTEGGFAVVESFGGMEDVPLSWFSAMPSDGDAVEVFWEEERAEVDNGATEKAMEEVRAVIESLVDTE